MLEGSRLNVSSGRLTAVVVALLVMVLAGVVRQFTVTPEDVDRIRVLSEFTGLDFGRLPAWFASGAGGDAEAFAVMAADPFGVDEAHLIRRPVYRFTMVGFPWLVWLLAFGREELILVVMSMIGLFSVGAIAFIAVRQRDRLGSRAWLLLLNPALFLGFFGDSSEPLALLLLTLAFTLSTAWIAVPLAMVRPPFLTGVADMRKSFVIGVTVAIAIRLLAAWRFGGSFLDGSYNLGIPFGGFIEAPSVIGLAVIIAGLFTLILGVWTRSISWVLSGLLVVMMSAVVFDTPLNALRGAGVLPVLWAFGGQQTGARWPNGSDISPVLNVAVPDADQDDSSG